MICKTTPSTQNKVIKEALIYNILWHSTLNKILTFYKSYDLYYNLRSLFKIHEKITFN